MAKKEDSIFETLVESPWWVSVIFAAFVYFALGIMLPSMAFSSPAFGGIQRAISSLAPLIALVFLLPAPLSLLNATRKRVLLDKQTGLKTIKELSWKSFEELVGEAYRRLGYQVIENTAGGADGGVDLRLVKGGNTILVQCKQWRSQSVGVKTVREMYGVMVAEQANEVFIVCTGSFTTDAQQFAKGKPIQLITGERLQSLVSDVRSTPREHLVIQQATMDVLNAQTQVCPRCSSNLVLRKAKRGANAGSEFYGCAGFPKCRYTKSI